MRKELLLQADAPAPVRRLDELYAIAFDLAQRRRRYGITCGADHENFRPVRAVFACGWRHANAIVPSVGRGLCCACGKPPDTTDLRWTPIDLVPPPKLPISRFRLATPYAAWALAATPPPTRVCFLDLRHRAHRRSTGPVNGRGLCARGAERLQSLGAASDGWHGALNGMQDRRTRCLIKASSSPRRRRCSKASSSRT